MWLESLREYAAGKLNQNLGQIERCAGILTLEELWFRPNEHCNAVGNLILHLAGNIRQWIVGGLGGGAMQRDRIAEFGERRPRSAAEIAPILRGATHEAIEIIKELSTDAAERFYMIQSYRVAGIVAVMHVVEHYSFHTGQIVHITKSLRDVDLSLYNSGGQKLAGGNVVP